MSEKELMLLKDLVRYREDVIKLRVSLGNRIGAKKTETVGHLRKGTVFVVINMLCY